MISIEKKTSARVTFTKCLDFKYPDLSPKCYLEMLTTNWKRLTTRLVMRVFVNDCTISVHIRHAREGGHVLILFDGINQKTSSIWKNLAYLYWGIKITTDKINNYVIHRSLIVPRRKKIQGTGYNYQHFTEPSRINLKKEPSRLLKFFAPTCRRTGFKEIVHIRKKVERNVHNWR